MGGKRGREGRGSVLALWPGGPPRLDQGELRPAEAGIGADSGMASRIQPHEQTASQRDFTLYSGQSATGRQTDQAVLANSQGSPRDRQSSVTWVTLGPPPTCARHRPNQSDSRESS